MIAWLYLLLAAVFEVGFTTTLRFTEGFRNVRATAACVVCVLASIFFLELAARAIPLGTGYAIWTGIGAIGTVLIGMVWFGEPATLVRGLLILGIIFSVIGLKLTSGQ